MLDHVSHVLSCDHPSCVATRDLIRCGASLVFGSGRHCELAAVAAAGRDGIAAGEVVAARRAYSLHLVAAGAAHPIAGRPTADSPSPIHVRKACEGPGARSNAIKLGTARVRDVGGRFFIEFDAGRSGGARFDAELDTAADWQGHEVDEENVRDLLRAETSATGSRWFDLVGWVEPEGAASVRRYYSALVAPIIAAAGAELHAPGPVRRAAADMLDELVWGVTTLTNSSRWSVRFVSRGAKEVFALLQDAAMRRRLTADGRPLLKRLRHEHVLERADIVHGLLAAGGDASALAEAEACIVTVDDHRDLRDADGTGWDRYRSARIDVWDRRANGSWFLLNA